MSDIQDYPIRQTSQLQQVQQRQILALMGIEPWIKTESPTLDIASIDMPTLHQPATLIALQPPVTQNSPVVSVGTQNIRAINSEQNNLEDIEQDNFEGIEQANIKQNSIEQSREVSHIDNNENLEALNSLPLGKPAQVTRVQQQVQQRQILAMMGIEQWVQPAAPTLNIADIDTVNITPAASSRPAISDGIAATNSDNRNKHNNNDISDNRKSDNRNSDNSDLPLNKEAIEVAESWADSATPAFEEDASLNYQQPVTADIIHKNDIKHINHINDITPPTAPVSIDENITNNAIEQPTDNTGSLDKVAPFDLQGGRYGNWILLVDIQALNNDSQTLWQNITQALSLTCETLSFPICRGEDAPYLANASLAGYIFRLSGMSETLQVATLTALPDGLLHPNIVKVPTLGDMLADSQLKRQLWQQLAQ